MATPEIKTRQLNPADLKRLEDTKTSMPQKEKVSSTELTDGLSGKKTATFGSLSTKGSALASSLETKTSSPAGETPAPAGDTKTSQDVSIYEQGTLKSRLSTVQSTIIGTKNSSIFSDTKAGTAASGDTVELAGASEVKYTYISSAKANIGLAQKAASDAEAALKSGNYTLAIQLYSQADAKIKAAQDEMIQADKQGGEEAAAAAQLNDTVSGLCRTIKDGSAAASQGQKLAYQAQKNYSANNSTTSNGNSGLTTGQQVASGITTGILNGISGGNQSGKSDSKKDDSKEAGTSKKPDSTKSTDGAKPTEKPTETKKTASKGVPSSNSSTSNIAKGPNLNGANDAAKKEIESQGLTNTFKGASDAIGNNIIAKADAQKAIVKADADIDKLNDDISKEEGQLKKSVKQYNDAKAKEAEYTQKFNEQNSLAEAYSKALKQYGDQKAALTTKLGDDSSGLIKGENDAKNTYCGADGKGGKVGETIAAQNKLKVKQSEVAAAEKELAAAKENGGDTAAAESKLQAAIEAREKAERDLMKAQEAEKNAKIAWETKQKERISTEKEIKVLDDTIKSTSEKQQDAKEKACGEDGNGGYQAEMKKWAKEAEDQSKSLQDSTKTAQDYKDRIDKLYAAQTDAHKKFSEADAQIEVNKTLQNTTQKQITTIIDEHNKTPDDPADRPINWKSVFTLGICD